MDTMKAKGQQGGKKNEQKLQQSGKVKGTARKRS